MILFHLEHEIRIAAELAGHDRHAVVLGFAAQILVEDEGNVAVGHVMHQGKDLRVPFRFHEQNRDIRQELCIWRRFLGKRA